MDTSSKKSCSYANKVHMDVGAMRPHYACGQHPRHALSVVSRLAPAYTQAAQQVALLPILPACRRLVGNTCLLVALLPRPCPSNVNTQWNAIHLILARLQQPGPLFPMFHLDGDIFQKLVVPSGKGRDFEQDLWEAVFLLYLSFPPHLFHPLPSPPMSWLQLLCRSPAQSSSPPIVCLIWEPGDSTE